VGILDDEVATTWLAITLFHRWDVVATVVRPESLQMLQRSQNGLVSVLPADHMLLVGVDVIPVHVNDVRIARADHLRRGSLLQLRNRHTKVLAKPRRPRSLALLRRP